MNACNDRESHILVSRGQSLGVRSCLFLKDSACLGPGRMAAPPEIDGVSRPGHVDSAAGAPRTAPGPRPPRCSRTRRQDRGTQCGMWWPSVADRFPERCPVASKRDRVLRVNPVEGATDRTSTRERSKAPRHASTVASEVGSRPLRGSRSGPCNDGPDLNGAFRCQPVSTRPPRG